MLLRLIKRKNSPLLRLLLRLKRRLILLLQLSTATNILKHFHQLLRILSRHGLHIALKDEKIARLEQYANGGELSLVLFERHGLIIDLIFARAFGGDDAREEGGLAPGQLLGETALRLLGGGGTAPLFFVGVLLALLVGFDVDQCRLGRQRLVPCRAGGTKNEIAHLAGTQRARLDAEDEGYGVHEVGFSGTIGADDAGEVEEGADALSARVGFEVFEFEVGYRHG
mmetsp:Transcript_34263/g.72158  ORF Transcript_34263/g.72158 Transcript_34263/m.72158 type:complete len:226 (-) Transcript_34263:417-1094(-)